MEITMQEVDRETYASHTRNLPKTNFGEMRILANRIVDSRFTPEAINWLLMGDGVEVGRRMIDACLHQEKMLEGVNFNAFNDPAPLSVFTRHLNDMVISLSIIYLMRSRIRQFDMPLENISVFYRQMNTAAEDIKGIFSSLVSLAQQKDAEYGASWCKRGGIGAWFTTVRKFDRLTTQIRNKGDNIWDVSDSGTESLEETIMDAINYLLLILEKRQVIFSTR